MGYNICMCVLWYHIIRESVEKSGCLSMEQVSRCCIYSYSTKPVYSDNYSSYKLEGPLLLFSNYIRVPQNFVTKWTFLGTLDTYICVILNPLRIFVPRVKIHFFINNYFPLCIFKYCTSLLKFHWYVNLNSGLEI